MDAQKSALAIATFGLVELMGAGVIQHLVNKKTFKEFKAHHLVILSTLGLALGYMAYQITPATPIITPPTPPKTDTGNCTVTT